LHLVHRNGVMILPEKKEIVSLDTPGNYPHNGLGGIAFSEDGWLYIGMGENLGEKYTIKGSDGSSHSGGGEGGNVFRCKPDGTKLEFVATGFWNAFALAFNRAGYLFCVDNDPDSRPPCRLIDVGPDSLVRFAVSARERMLGNQAGGCSPMTHADWGRFSLAVLLVLGLLALHATSAYADAYPNRDEHKEPPVANNEVVHTEQRPGGESMSAPNRAWPTVPGFHPLPATMRRSPLSPRYCNTLECCTPMARAAC